MPPQPKCTGWAYSLLERLALLVQATSWARTASVHLLGHELLGSKLMSAGDPVRSYLDPGMGFASPSC